MKKNTFKSLLFYSFMLFALFLTAQTTAPDEDTGAYTICNPDGENATRTSDDLPNPVNVGTIDDRSCYANYKESNVYENTWGIYNITEGSNKFDSFLQPRIERSLPRSQTTGVGSYARFTGTVRILEVGFAGIPFLDGSYIMQAKGKHTGGGGSPDPAICLYLAQPIYGSGANSNVQVSFDIFREQIVNREGQREFVFLTNIPKDVPTDIELEVGFREDPNDSSKKIHYADAVIGGQAFNWNIPEPERGIQSGVRYGAYRVKGGRAQIRWANTTYQMEEVEAEPVVSEDPDLTEGVYSLKNVATGKFLTDAGLAATPVVMSDSDEAQNTHWTFVNSGAFFNIDSEVSEMGILRAPGSSGPGGPYVVVSTERPSPESTSDKLWIIRYNESDETFRFESSTGRYLYHEANGNVTHALAFETDNRSKWEAILVSEPLSLDKNELLSSAISVFPNPANDNFTIALKNLDQVEVKIFDILGKAVFESQSIGSDVHINNNGQFKSGVYLVKVIDGNNKLYYTKLVMK